MENKVNLTLDGCRIQYNNILLTERKQFCRTDKGYFFNPAVKARISTDFLMNLLNPAFNLYYINVLNKKLSDLAIKGEVIF